MYKGMKWAQEQAAGLLQRVRVACGGPVGCGSETGYEDPELVGAAMHLHHAVAALHSRQRRLGKVVRHGATIKAILVAMEELQKDAVR